MTQQFSLCPGCGTGIEMSPISSLTRHDCPNSNAFTELNREKFYANVRELAEIKFVMKKRIEELLAENLILRNALEEIIAERVYPFMGCNALELATYRREQDIGTASAALAQTQPNPILDVVKAAENVRTSRYPERSHVPELRAALDKYHTWLEGK